MAENKKNQDKLQQSFLPRLTSSQCEKIHAASLEILDRIGVRLDLKEALTLLQKAGARIEDGNLAFVPASLIEKALSTAPQQVTLYSRNRDPVMSVAGNSCFYGAGSDCLNIIDHRTGLRRPALLKDVHEGIVLCDGLPDIDFVMSMVLPSDVDGTMADRFQMAAMLEHTSKPLIFVTYEYSGCRDCVEMAEIVAGGADSLAQKPNIACYINVVSGLVHNKDSLEKLLFLASKNLPLLYIPSSTAGVTSPVTPAGSLAMDYAGVLVGVVLAQLVREGTPVVVPGMPPGNLDMRTMVSTYCEPERGHSQALAHYFGLPMFSLGGASESKIVDQQAAAEAALTLLTESLGGGHLIHDLGYLESGLTFSFQQLVICAEIVSWIKGFCSEIEISDDTLAMDIIAEVGHDGQFLDKMHTRNNYRKRWYPKLFERMTYKGWLDAGGKTTAERAADKVNNILAEHTPEPLSADIKRKLHRLLSKSGGILKSR